MAPPHFHVLLHFCWKNCCSSEHPHMVCLLRPVSVLPSLSTCPVFLQTKHRSQEQLHIPQEDRAAHLGNGPPRVRDLNLAFTVPFLEKVWIRNSWPKQTAHSPLPLPSVPPPFFSLLLLCLLPFFLFLLVLSFTFQSTIRAHMCLETPSLEG